MSEYLEQFEQLSHSILLYNPSYADTYFVTREDIRAAIALHRPKNIQEASSLAPLQEAELESCRKKQAKEFGRASYKSSTIFDRVKIQPSDTGPAVKNKSAGPDSDDKLKALMAFRRQNGLCF